MSNAQYGNRQSVKHSESEHYIARVENELSDFYDEDRARLVQILEDIWREHTCCTCIVEEERGHFHVGSVIH